MTVLITGANSCISRHVINVLLAKPKCPPLRLLVHSQSSQDKLAYSFPQLRSSPHSFIIADYLNPTTLTPALKDITIIFHNGAASHTLEREMGIAVIDAAKESDLDPHFIFCSTLHPMLIKLPDHKAKLAIEEYLAESKLNYTILQPAHLMQNLSLPTVRETGVISLGYSPSVTQGFLDLVDLAEVVRVVMISPQHHNLASYELLSENLPYSSVAEMIGQGWGTSIKCQVSPKKNLSPDGDYASERTLLYYNRWGVTGNPNILRWLLGREPTTWYQYIRRESAI